MSFQIVTHFCGILDKLTTQMKFVVDKTPKTLCWHKLRHSRHKTWKSASVTSCLGYGQVEEVKEKN